MLTGPRAAALGTLDLAAQAADGSISIAELRELLLVTQALPPGELELHGSFCRVAAAAPPAAQPDTHAAPIAADAPHGPTLEDHLRAHLAAMFAVPDDALRITFDDRSAALRATPVTARTVEIRATGRSARTPLAITIFEGSALVDEGNVRADVVLRRTVLTLTAPVRRGEIISPELVRVGEAWLASDVLPLHPERALGRVATRNLDAGAMLTAPDVDRPIAVKRGDIVSVRSVVGTASVRTRARALAAGGEGDVIDLEVLGSRARITARVIGPGRAVIADRAEQPETLPIAME
jgi:flagella basal body P-ring formation protein FlgA